MWIRFHVRGNSISIEKMLVEMREWYDVKVRGIMGSGKGEARELENLGRSLRWTKE